MLSMIIRRIRDKIGFSPLNRKRAVINCQDDLESYLDGDTYRLPDYAVMNNCKIVLRENEKLLAKNLMMEETAIIEPGHATAANAHSSFEDKDLEILKLIHGVTDGEGNAEYETELLPTAKRDLSKQAKDEGGSE